VETWGEVRQFVPRELEPWLLQHDWSPEKLRSLLLPVTEIELAELAWLLDLPFWRDDEGTAFRVRPIDVTGGWHLDRVASADLASPLDVTMLHGRFVVLDGLHRLLKAARVGRRTLPARIVPPEALRLIAA
jgi:hypothetical protein